MSADSLICPLAEGTAAAGDQPAESPVTTDRGFRSRCFKAADATKARLLETLHPSTGTPPPAVLFTASHGMGWPKDDVRAAIGAGCDYCARTGRGSVRVAPAHYLTAPEIEPGATSAAWSHSYSRAMEPARPPAIIF